MLLARETTEVTLALRRFDATATEPVEARFLVNGLATSVLMDSDDWRTVTFTFEPSLLAWLRKGQRVDVTISPWFVLAEQDPQSSDLRRFGAQIRLVNIASTP